MISSTPKAPALPKARAAALALGCGLSLSAAVSHAQVPISCGQTIAGSISTAGEQDTYTFRVDNGTLVLVLDTSW